LHVGKNVASLQSIALGTNGILYIPQLLSGNAKLCGNGKRVARHLAGSGECADRGFNVFDFHGIHLNRF